MLSTFTTKDGLLVIRSEDLRRIEDRGGGCLITFLIGNEQMDRPILGTAQENLDRISAEERAALATYTEMQARAQQGLPALPVVRGEKAGR